MWIPYCSREIHVLREFVRLVMPPKTFVFEFASGRLCYYILLFCKTLQQNIMAAKFVTSHHVMHKIQLALNLFIVLTSNSSTIQHSISLYFSVLCIIPRPFFQLIAKSGSNHNQNSYKCIALETQKSSEFHYIYHFSKPLLPS